jgi:hypothetical protein
VKMPLPYPLLNLVHFGISFAFTRAIGANLGGWFLEGRAPVEIAVEIDPARFRRTRGTARQFLVDRTATIARDFVRLTFGAERPGVLAIVARSHGASRTTGSPSMRRRRGPRSRRFDCSLKYADPHHQVTRVR